MVLSWKRAFDHPAIAVVCLVLSAFFGVMWFRADLSLRAPSVAGYSWNQHPRTLLVYFNGATGCACAADLKSSVEQVLQYSADVVIVGTDNKMSELQFGSLSSHPHLKFIVTRRLTSPDPISEGQSRLYCVRNGRIVKRAYGTIVPASFLTKEGIGI